LGLPVDEAAFVSQTPYFYWSDSQDTASGIFGYDIEVSTSDDFTTLFYNTQPTISQATSTALSTGKYFWRIKAKDVANNYSVYSSTWAVFIDTVAPTITNYATGDDDWHKSSGTVYNVDIADEGDSLLLSFSYAVYSSSNQEGAQLVGFAGGTIADNILASDYDTNWSISEANWALLENGTNYVSVKAIDRAGNEIIEKDVFYIRKDALVPQITDNQAGDTIWRKASGAVYYIDFTDTGGSKLSKFQLKITSGPDETGIVYSDWFDRVLNLDADSYNTDFDIGISTWVLLAEGTSYVSVKVFDIADNEAALTDAFYIRKDTTVPDAVTLTSPEDASFSNTLNPSFNWSDSQDGASGINGYEIAISTYENFSLLYSSAFVSISQYQISDLNSGRYYWRARAKDNANNYSAYTSTWSVFIDTITPTIDNNQLGDDSWRAGDAGAIYNVDFADTGDSLLSSLEYSIWTEENFGGSNLASWTLSIARPAAIASYVDAWSVDFDLLQNGTNYVSVKIIDQAGNETTEKDVFYIRKDILSPQIADNQTGDNVWRNNSAAVYNINFTDTGGSKLSKFQLKITSGPSQTGIVYSDWFDRISNISADAYHIDFDLGYSTWTLLGAGTSYISVKVFDEAGNNADLSDAFYIRKDTTAPTITDNQTGDDAWRSSNGGIYNINFGDLGGSNLAYFQIKVTTGALQTGTLIADWTTVISGINILTYEDDWELPSVVFTAMASGKNYVSIKAFDGSGLSKSLSDAFYVNKSTLAPQITDNQDGDDIWSSSPGTLYDIDFEDVGSSNLDVAQYKIMSGEYPTGSLVKDWTNIASNINQSSYMANWSVDFSALLEEVTNYVSVRVWDKFLNLFG
jgi:hypothetical protein